MKITIKKVLTIVTILSLLSTIVLGWFAIFKSNEADRYANNYKASQTKIVKYRDKNNNLVTEITELRLTKEEIINSKDSAIMLLASEIKAMDLKVKHTERMNRIITESSNSGISVFNDTNIVLIKDTIPYYKAIKHTTISDSYLTANLKLDADTLNWEYCYKDSIIVVDHKVRDPLTRKGKKRFILFQYIVPRWIHKTSVKSLNPNTEITGVLKIKVEKRKGLKRK